LVSNRKREKVVAFPRIAFDTKDPRVVLLTEICESCGVCLYDVVFPVAFSGVLQVVISAKEWVTQLRSELVDSGDSDEIGSNKALLAVGHEECSRVARNIIDSERVEELLPGSVTLEVSSPGINRELKSIEHLKGAVGERLRVVVSDFKELGVDDREVEKNPSGAFDFASASLADDSAEHGKQKGRANKTSSNRKKIVGKNGPDSGSRKSRAGVIRGVLRSVSVSAASHSGSKMNTKGEDGVDSLEQDNLSLILEDEDRATSVVVTLQDLKEARVDFQFSNR
jgi:hypothetical protein